MVLSVRGRPLDRDRVSGDCLPIGRKTLQQSLNAVEFALVSHPKSLQDGHSVWRYVEKRIQVNELTA
jgi:hypothetical protein